jgi:uncharacterized repeat protein (TIGR01451 family)
LTGASASSRRRRSFWRFTERLDRLETRLLPTAYVVTSIADSGPGTLRQAILDSNANPGTTNSISFQITGTGVQTIELLSTLTITAPVVLDATTQPGYAGSPLIALDGSNETTAGSAIVISAGNTTIKGLSINGFSGDGIDLESSGNDVITANILGSATAGATSHANSGDGILVDGVADNLITQNTISGNQGAGLAVQGAGAVHNVISGNFIGTDSTGESANANSAGVAIMASASTNTVGGTTASDRNVISGNTNAGVFVSDQGTAGNIIEGNYIGTDATGSAALGNLYGVTVQSGAVGTMIGGDQQGTGNLIASNNGDEIRLVDTMPHSKLQTVVWGNLIGTDKTGAVVLPHGGSGVTMLETDNNTVGGSGPGQRNVISTGSHAGVNIQGADSGNIIQGNFIGTDVTGSTALGNYDGVLFAGGASDNTVGGAAAGAGNIISGSTDIGVHIEVSGTTNIVVEGNFVGIDRTGKIALPNTNYGVLIERSATNNTIGGIASGAGNLIAGNSGLGLAIVGSGTSGNVVQGNLVGTDSTGRSALPNTRGIGIFGGATGNTIGGLDPGARNVISGNTGDGVEISDAGTSSNVVLGNTIGTDINGEAAVPNGNFGVSVYNGATNNTVGGTETAAGNVISGNTHAGIALNVAGTSGNVVLGNLIGLNKEGTTALGNEYGLDIYLGASGNTIGGTAAGSGNVISGNRVDGIRFTNTGTSDNVVEGNAIGTNSARTGAIPNLANGVEIGASASSNTVGGTAPDAGNLISGNVQTGVIIWGSGTSANLIAGNTIGNAGGGQQYGVEIIQGAAQNMIGAASAGNTIITGDNETAIVISDLGSDGNQLIDNTIQGTGNSQFAAPGISISAASYTVIDGNQIVFADSAGIELANLAGTKIQGNSISRSGLAGIEIDGASAGNIIGGELGPSESNVLERNGGAGILLNGANVANTFIQGNYIGIDPAHYQNPAAGPVNTGNASDGITLGGRNNKVGGLVAEGNVISENAGAGINIVGQGVGNSLFSNRVFGNHGAAQIVRQTPIAVLPPKLTLAHTTLFGTAIQGLVQPLAGAFGTYRVEVFATDPTTGFSGSMGGQAVSVNSNAPTAFELAGAPTSAGETLLATVTDPQGNTSTFSPSFTVQTGAADVSVTAVGVPTSILVGQTITYTFVITNHGPTLATGMGFFDTLPSGVTLVSAAVTPPPLPGRSNSGDQFVLATIGDLAASASVTVTITVLPKGVGPTTNKINVALAENDPNVSNNALTSNVNVQPRAADVSVTALGVPTSIIVGQAITYTFVITNHGPTLATGVGFLDTLPADVTLVSAAVTPPTGPGQLNSDDQFVHCTLGDLAPSASAIVMITVLPKGIGPTANTINVALAEHDPNLSNNALTTNVNVLPPPITATSFSLATQTVKRHKQSVIEIGFGGAIDPATATNGAFYTIVTAGRNGQFGTKGSVVVAIASIQVAPSQTAVILVPKTTLPKNKALQVSVSAGGVHDSFGRPLVGANAMGQIVGTINGSVSKAKMQASEFKLVGR